MSRTDQHSTSDGVDPHSFHPHGVDPSEEPSAAWGWHGKFPVAGPLAGWFTAFALFAMLIGNHQSHVENVYLVGLGTLLVMMLIGHHLRARKARRRFRS